MPLPGNDESMDAMVFYNDSISNYILFKKLILVISWFFRLRSPNRLLSFKEWLSIKFNSTCNQLGTVRTLNLFSMIDTTFLTYYMRQGLKFYFSHNNGLEFAGGYLDIQYPKNFSIDVSDFLLEPLKTKKRLRFFFKWMTLCIIIVLEQLRNVDDWIFANLLIVN